MGATAAVNLVTAAVLIGICAIIVRHDLRQRRIPNVCVLSIWALSAIDMAFNVAQLPCWPGLPSVTQRLAASAVVLFAGYTLEIVSRLLRHGKHGMGFGDIKLFSACAAWLGFDVLYCIVLACASAVIWSTATSARTFAFGPHIVWSFLAALGFLALT